MKSVYLKELRSYFTSVSSYACFTLMFLIAGIFTWAYNIQSSSAAFESTLSSMAFFIMLLPVPLLTMKTFAEERKQKTDQLLYSLPLKTSEIVLGKFFAAITVFAAPIVIIGLFPLLFSLFGSVNLATCYSTLFSVFLTGVSCIAIGLFVSSLVENQIVAAIGTAVIIFANYYLPYISSVVSEKAVATTIFLLVIGLLIGLVVFFMTKNYMIGLVTAIVINFALVLIYYLKSDLLEGLLPKILTNISVFNPISTFAGGVFSLASIVFYLSAMGIFLFLTIQSLEKRRWA